MQAPISLRIGVHIEQSTTLSLVQAMLREAGHHYRIDPPGLHSLATYLGIVLDQVRQTKSAPYDLLIVGGTEADTLTNPATLIAFSRLLTLFRLPMMVLTSTQSLSMEAEQEFELVAVLPLGSLSMYLFFQTLGRLTGTSTTISTSSFESGRPGTLEERQQRLRELEERQQQLREEERQQIEIRKHWLDQRQEWFDQRQAWLDQRQAWLEKRRNEQAPQQEWLAEQTAWIAEQRREVEDQQRKVCDLRRWIARYERSIGEEPGASQMFG